jgi:hypothetical protein
MDIPELIFSRVVCAAIKFYDQRYDKEIVVTSARHYDRLMHETLKMIGRDYLKEIEQGFIDQFGNFLTREEALEIATRNGQIYRRCGGDHVRLYSENLY